MKRFIRGMIVLITCMASFVSHAQEVTLITEGQGSTKELAIRNALVSAIEQTYGVYVSGDTHILNDELIRDEVVEIKRGNVKMYNVIGQTKEADGYRVMVNATVSTDKLLKFAQSKGASCELAGRTFAANLMLHKLHLSSGAKAMEQLYNMLGWLAPRIYDYKLNLGNPIMYKSDVYIPIAVNCVPNENYRTFIDLYDGTTNSIAAAIASVPVQGDTNDSNMRKIEQYKEYIQTLPQIWAMGFLLRDNLDNFVIPQLNSLSVHMPDNAFWPSYGVKSYKISNSGTYESIYGLSPHSYITYNGEIVFIAKGVGIQKLDYEPLCSLSEGQSGGKVLRDYVRHVEQEFSIATTGVSYANDTYNIRDFDGRMATWSNGKRTVNRYNWVNNPTKIIGKIFCTINFFICYKEADISKVSDIKVESILQED